MRTSKASFSVFSNLSALLAFCLFVIGLIAFLSVDANAAWTKKMIDGGDISDTSIAIDSKRKVNISEIKYDRLFYFNNATG